MMKIGLIACLFGVTAALYASVGFGGGSTYTALLVASGADYRVIPIVALTCNILVVSGNSFRYARQHLVPWNRLWPLILVSVPAAWIGGRVEVSETLFIGLLWAALGLAGMRLLFAKAPHDWDETNALPVWQTGLIGAAIGLYSGLVGIGGGIFLAPVLHFKRWGNAKMIAATCSIFILVNSLAGLSGQWMKLSGSAYLAEVAAYWPVLPTVLIGGYIGNRFGIFNLSQQTVKRLTALLILIVALRLAVQWFGLLLA